MFKPGLKSLYKHAGQLVNGNVKESLQNFMFMTYYACNLRGFGMYMVYMGILISNIPKTSQITSTIGHKHGRPQHKADVQ